MRARSLPAKNGPKEPLLASKTTCERTWMADWIESVQPQEKDSNKRTSVSDAKGPRFQCVWRYVDQIWDGVASGVVFDFFNCHVWSRPLAAMSVLGLMTGLASFTLEGMFPLTLSSSCIDARNLGSCHSKLCADHRSSTMAIPIDPEFFLERLQEWMGKTPQANHEYHIKKLEFGWDAVPWMVFFMLLYLANSAYRTEELPCKCNLATFLRWTWISMRSLALVLGAIWLQAMFTFTWKDIGECDLDTPTRFINWTDYQPNSGIAQVAMGSTWEPHSTKTTTTTAWPKHVADFCSFNAIDYYPTKGDGGEKILQNFEGVESSFDANANIAGNEMKNVWAAWMDLATFNKSLTNATETLRYCHRIMGPVKPVVAACLAWLNNTKATGNRIECLHNANFTLDPELKEIINQRQIMQFMMGGVFRDADWKGFTDADWKGFKDSASNSTGDTDLLQELTKSKCFAIVDGSNFAVKPPSQIEGVLRPFPGAVAEHLLSLASWGLPCSGSDMTGSGEQQAEARNKYACTYAKRLLEKTDSKLEIKHKYAPYMHHEFVESVVRQVWECEERLFSFAWTQLASRSIFMFVSIMCVNYVWMVYLRLASSGPCHRFIVLSFAAVVFFMLGEASQHALRENVHAALDKKTYTWETFRSWMGFLISHYSLFSLSVVFGAIHLLMCACGCKSWLVPPCARGSSHFTAEESEREMTGVDGQNCLMKWFCMRFTCSEWLRVIFSSRVMLGFALSAILQVSFTYAMCIFVFPLFDELASKMCQDDFCRNGMYFGSRGAVGGQGIIVLIAVVWNVQRYFCLREFIMKLPYNVLFGEESYMGHHYHGIDLHEFKEMAESSVLLAMQFPGMVFWHFFIGSWVMVAVLGLIFVPIINSFVGWNPTCWKISKWASILCLLHFANYLTRCYVQRCILHQPRHGTRGELSRDDDDVHIRCACFFSLWELWSLALGLVIGPVNAAYDFVFGLLTTTISNLVVDKPNYIQFGELSDYVYCSYCALLYLERMREEARRRAYKQARAHKEATSAFKAQDVEPEVERTGYRAHCPIWCCGFVVVQIVIPGLMIGFIFGLSYVLPVFPPEELRKYKELPS